MIAHDIKMHGTIPQGYTESQLIETVIHNRVTERSMQEGQGTVIAGEGQGKMGPPVKEFCPC